MKRVMIGLLLAMPIAVVAQTKHNVTVAINQGETCNNIVGIDPETQLFKIFPNPSSKFISIQSKIQRAKIHIYTINGNLVESLDYTGGNFQLNVAGYPSGTYLLHFISSELSEHRKIKIQ